MVLARTGLYTLPIEGLSTCSLPDMSMTVRRGTLSASVCESAYWPLVQFRIDSLIKPGTTCPSVAAFFV